MVHINKSINVYKWITLEIQRYKGILSDNNLRKPYISFQ